MGIQEMPAGSDPNTPLRANNSPIEPVVYPGRHGKKVRALNIVNLYPEILPDGPWMGPEVVLGPDLEVEDRENLL